MERLSGLDATFLYMETPHMHMHVASTCVFDPTDVEGGYSFERVKAMVENRLPLLPPFRRRLVEVPFALHHPLWIEDPNFDLDYHLRRACLPSPGGHRELADFAADVMGRPLDRSRPLWEMYIVEGLEGGLVAVVTKTHHAAIDGVSGEELTVNLLDLQPEPALVPPPDPPWHPDRVPTDFELVGWALYSLSRQPLAAAKAVRRTVETALNLRRRNKVPGSAPPPAPFSAPRTPLNVSITPHRRFAFAEVSLDDVKMVKNALGGTVNDVVLAVCSGALRRYLAEKGEEPESSLVAMVPISVRTRGEKGGLGNQVTAMLVSLASTIDDPVDRLRAISGGVSVAKDQEKAIGADTLTNWAEFAAPAVAARAARLVSNMRVFDRVRPLFNVVISNVPGPNVPLYSVGARMTAIYPMGPVAEGVGLNITVMSYMGVMYFGLVAGREAVPEVDAISRYLVDALEELKKPADAMVGGASRAQDPPGRPAQRPAAKRAAAKSPAAKRPSGRQAGGPAKKRS